MMKYFGVVSISWLLIGCSEKKQESQLETPAETVVNAENQLSPQQVSEGWKNLFDGKSLNGWAFYKNRENDSWEVVDGVLHLKSFDSASVRSDLRTSEQFKNFELSFDWKVAPASNTGVMYRVTEELDQPYFTGPEYQILDDIGSPGEKQDWQLTGSTYGMYAAPANKRLNPVGEWNNTRIVVNGNRVQHWLNGEKMTEYELQSEDWKKLKAASKWKDEKSYGVPETGYIVLQDHSSEAWFKNIFVHPLQ